MSLRVIDKAFWACVAVASVWLFVALLTSCAIFNAVQKGGFVVWTSSGEVAIDEWDDLYKARCLFNTILPDKGLKPLGEVPVQVNLVYPRPEGSRLMGYYHYQREEIYILLQEPDTPWEDTALLHEMWHLYEHQVMGFSYRDWVKAQTAGGPHFFMGDRAFEIIAEMKDHARQGTHKCME